MFSIAVIVGLENQNIVKTSVFVKDIASFLILNTQRWFSHYIQFAKKVF